MVGYVFGIPFEYVGIVVIPLIFWFSFTILVTYQCWNSEKYSTKEKIIWSVFFFLSLFVFLLGQLIYAMKNYKSDLKVLLIFFAIFFGIWLLIFMPALLIGFVVASLSV